MCGPLGFGWGLLGWVGSGWGAGLLGLRQLSFAAMCPITAGVNRHRGVGGRRYLRDTTEPAGPKGQHRR